jgi:hypothetical protein
MRDLILILTDEERKMLVHALEVLDDSWYGNNCDKALLNGLIYALDVAQIVGESLERGSGPLARLWQWLNRRCLGRIKV